MKSNKRTIGILIVVIVILFGFACSLLIYRNKLESKNKTNRNFEDYYEIEIEVDKEIDNILILTNLSNDEKRTKY